MAYHLFKHSQLESVKAWIDQPEYAHYPLYLRIQRALRRLILDAVLQAGKPLPASRALALSLSVSRDTVENAYSLLHAEGYIERRVGSGSFVSEMPSLQKSKSKIKISALLQEDTTSQLSERGKIIAAHKKSLSENLIPQPFAPGIAETRMFPLSLWERLERQVLKEKGVQALQSDDPQGVYELRSAIANYVNLERGAHATPERILILTSSQQAITLCANILFDNGERIFSENPLYQGALKAFEAAGLTPLPIPVDEQGLAVEVLKQSCQQAKAVFLTPSHQYPMGVTLSLERRLALIEWANENRSWIIEDDYDSEFHYAGKPIACVQGLDPYNRTIYIGTFTKSLFPGLRIGYMILPPSLVGPMTSARILQDGHNATIPQLTLARFIENGHFGAYIRQMRRVYAERLSLINQLISTQLADFLIAYPPHGGMQMACLLICPINENDIIEAAKKEHIKLIGLSSLYIGSPTKSGFLLGFAAYTPREITLAIDKIVKILDKMTLIKSKK